MTVVEVHMYKPTLHILLNAHTMYGYVIISGIRNTGYMYMHSKTHSKTSILGPEGVQ